MQIVAVALFESSISPSAVVNNPLQVSSVLFSSKSCTFKVDVKLRDSSFAAILLVKFAVTFSNEYN